MLMASTAQIELWHAEKVATQVTVLQASNGIHYAAWQGIFVFEHRSAPHRRNVLLHLLGEQTR